MCIRDRALPMLHPHIGSPHSAICTASWGAQETARTCCASWFCVQKPPPTAGADVSHAGL
eukprot:1324196-Alexandrium_andersonii.AAC.1